MSPTPQRPAPPIVFDGFLHWYTEWFDPSEDRCSKCRELIAEESVPLMLFKGHGRQTWQARICERCLPVIVSRMGKAARN